MSHPNCLKGRLDLRNGQVAGVQVVVWIRMTLKLADALDSNNKRTRRTFIWTEQINTRRELEKPVSLLWSKRVGYET